MQQPNTKTDIDIRLENYLAQQRLSFTFEPFGTASKNPDYLFKKGDKAIIIECKEIEKVLLDNVTGFGSFDVMATANKLKKRINTATTQIKPHSSNADYSIILLGKTQGYDLGTQDVYWAMFGAPVIRVPIDLSNGRPLKEPYSDLTVRGEFRKNKPGTREMIFPHSYISGVGIIREFNGFTHYFRKVHNRLADERINRKAPFREQLKLSLALGDEVLAQHMEEIPEEYRNNREKMIYKVDIVTNPFATNPLPDSIFDSEFDETVIPPVVDDL